jgi:anti-anti-sigma factor
MDSSGLNVLTRVRAAAEDHGMRLTLRRVPDQARRILELTRMTEMFRID